MSNLKAILKEAVERLAGEVGRRVEMHTQAELNQHTLDGVIQLRSFAQDHLIDWNNARETATEQILPEGTRLIKAGSHVVLAIEQKPCVRPIRIDKRLLSHLRPSEGEATTGGTQIFQELSFPYVIFVVDLAPLQRALTQSYIFSSLRVYFRQLPLRSPADSLGCAILPNMSTTVCMGPKWDGAHGTVFEVCEQVISHFWGAPFTMDYTERWRDISRSYKELSDLAAWGKASKADPDFILNVKWHQGPRLNELMNLLVDMTRLDSSDTEFINNLTERLGRDLLRLVSQATKCDPALLDSIAESLESAMGGAKKRTKSPGNRK